MVGYLQKHRKVASNHTIEKRSSLPQYPLIANCCSGRNEPLWAPLPSTMEYLTSPALCRSCADNHCQRPDLTLVQVLGWGRDIGTRKYLTKRWVEHKWPWVTPAVFIYTLIEFFSIQAYKNILLISSYFWFLRSTSYFNKYIIVII